MDERSWLVAQMLSYSPISWMAFSGIVYGSARLGAARGLLCGYAVMLTLVAALDLYWIQGEMSKLGWDGSPDQDFFFHVGFILRALVIALVVLPAAVLGLWQKARTDGARQAREAA